MIPPTDPNKISDQRQCRCAIAGAGVSCEKNRGKKGRASLDRRARKWSPGVLFFGFLYFLFFF